MQKDLIYEHLVNIRSYRRVKSYILFRGNKLERPKFTDFFEYGRQDNNTNGVKYSILDRQGLYEMEVGIFKVLERIFPENTDFKKIKIHIHFFSNSIDKSFYQKCYQYSIKKSLNI